MVELSNERIEKILHEETVKEAEPKALLRSIYARYMHLYENYLANMDGLTDDGIAELKKYHEETESLVKHYYMDIPQDVCTGLREFDKLYTDNLLGHDWHSFIFGRYEDFRGRNMSGNKDEGRLKAEFTKQTLTAFYDAMDYIFRDSFGTDSQAAKRAVKGITGLLFGKK